LMGSTVTQELLLHLDEEKNLKPAQGGHLCAIPTLAAALSPQIQQLLWRQQHVACVRAKLLLAQPQYLASL